MSGAQAMDAVGPIGARTFMFDDGETLELGPLGARMLSHGEVEWTGARLVLGAGAGARDGHSKRKWRANLQCGDAERIIRRELASRGGRVTLFVSQAL